MKLQQMGNDDLFSTYDDHIVLRLHNAKNLNDTRKILSRFKEYLDSRSPSTDIAKSFLSQFANRSLRTQYRYAQMVKGFMKWYGDPLDDLRIKIPKTLPPYTKDDDIEKLLNAITEKKTHKRLIERDYLLVLVGWKTGMRRGELGELEAGDIHSDFLIVRNGKGGKDRPIPLAQTLAERLHEFCRNMKPTDKVFGLKPACISMKIASYARKAELNGFHTHSLRHKFATDLLEHNVNLKIVQELLGHESLETTQVYLSITDEAKRKAIDSLEGPKPEEAYIDDVSAGIYPFIYEPKDKGSEYRNG